ncbi:MAG: hypothetical protein Q4C87_04845 [Actinomycetaceae bacterium]|nr:hypothetical protein [Actinomycetaceae bacterium]
MLSAQWVEIIPSALVIVAAFLVPGGVMSWAAGLRSWLAVAATPLLSVSVIALSAIAAPYIGMKWGLVPILLGTLCGVLLFLPLRFLKARSEKWEGPWWLFPLGVLFGGGTHLYFLLGALREVDAFSQTYDGAFHINLLARIQSTGSASSLTAGFSVPTNPAFYPAAWHDVASIPLVLGVGSVPMNANAMLIVMTGILWPVGIGLLTGALGRSWTLAGAGALLSCAFSQMPTHLTWFGVLYPNLFSYILVALVLVLLMQFLLHERGRSQILVGVITLVSMPGVAIAHPAALFTLAIMAMPLLTQSGIRAVVRRIRDIPTAICAGLTVATAFLALFVAGDLAILGNRSFYRMRFEVSFWEPVDHANNATMAFLHSSAGWTPSQGGPVIILLAALVFLGAIRALGEARAQWLALAHVLIGLLFIVAVSDQTPFRLYLTGLWYADINRLVAMVGLTQVPLAVLGVTTIVQAVKIAVSQWEAFPLRTGIAAASAVCMVIGINSATLDRNYGEIREMWAYDNTVTSTINLVTRSERALIERLDQHVAPDEVIFNNPWDGSVVVPALGHRNVLFPHLKIDGDPDAYHLAEYVNFAGKEAWICDTLQKRNIRWAIDFEGDYLWGRPDGAFHAGDWSLDRLIDDGGVRVVDQERRATLYEITACGPWE